MAPGNRWSVLLQQKFVFFFLMLLDSLDVRPGTAFLPWVCRWEVAAIRACFSPRKGKHGRLSLCPNEPGGDHRDLPLQQVGPGRSWIQLPSLYRRLSLEKDLHWHHPALHSKLIPYLCFPFGESFGVEKDCKRHFAPLHWEMSPGPHRRLTPAGFRHIHKPEPAWLWV